jgi:hypothetical protein
MNDTSYLVLYLLTAPQLRFRALLTEKGAESKLSRIFRVKEVSKHRNLLSD